MGPVRRLKKEYDDNQASPSEKFRVSPWPKNAGIWDYSDVYVNYNSYFYVKSDTELPELEWVAKLNGPKNTPYEGGEFKVRITFHQSYPFKEPSVAFSTKIFHPYISEESGRMCEHFICIMTKSGGWSPAMTISKVLNAMHDIIANYADNYHGHSVNLEAYKMLTENKQEFDRIAAEWTRLYAAPDPDQN